RPVLTTVGTYQAHGVPKGAFANFRESDGFPGATVDGGGAANRAPAGGSEEELRNQPRPARGGIRHRTPPLNRGQVDACYMGDRPRSWCLPNSTPPASWRSSALRRHGIARSRSLWCR